MLLEALNVFSVETGNVYIFTNEDGEDWTIEFLDEKNNGFLINSDKPINSLVVGFLTYQQIYYLFTHYKHAKRAENA